MSVHVYDFPLPDSSGPRVSSRQHAQDQAQQLGALFPALQPPDAGRLLLQVPAHSHSRTRCAAIFRDIPLHRLTDWQS